MKRGVLAFAAVLFLAACGGNSAATQQPSQAQPSRAQVTQPAQGGDAIDVSGIQAAVAALKAHDSWQFTVTTFESGTPNFSRTVTGTQRTAPQIAVSASHTVPGSSDFHYIRIGDDVWFDAGQATYTHTTAAEGPNLIVQYEPYYLDGLVQAAEANGYEYEPVGVETVSGVSAMHYRLSADDVDNIVESMTGITAAEWAADVWIAQADGSLMRLQWGPQSVDKAQLNPGFDYVVTSIDCVCPVDPPQ